MATLPGTSPARSRLPRGRHPDLESRVLKLETDMSNHVLPKLQEIDGKLSIIVDVVTATKTIRDYAVKYGAKTITFGAGVMTAAGIGNPKVMAFIVSFFT